MEQFIIIILLLFLVVLAIGIIFLKDLLIAIILLSIYSLIAAAIFIVMDAVDVAFTEAAVGAGISTILLLGALRFIRKDACSTEEKTTEFDMDNNEAANKKISNSVHQEQQKQHELMALCVVFITGCLLIYGTLDLPHYGDAAAAANTHPRLAQYFIYKSAEDTGLPNIVTSVLASYRGYDTLGETVVVFTAAVGVLSLLGLRRRRKSDD